VMDWRFVTSEIAIQTVVVCFLMAFAIALCVWTIRKDRKRHTPLSPLKRGITAPDSTWKRMIRG